MSELNIGIWIGIVLAVCVGVLGWVGLGLLRAASLRDFIEDEMRVQRDWFREDR